MKSLAPLVYATCGLGAILYAAVPPITPAYAASLSLSTPAAGVLVGAYTAGLLPGAILANRAAARFPVRSVVIAWLLLLAASCAAFGFASSFPALLAARTLQGVGGAVWATVLAWQLASAPVDRRGRMIGAAFAAASAGTVAGPLLGAAAQELGPANAFGLLSVAIVGLAALALRMPTTTAPATFPPLLAPCRQREIHFPLVVALLPCVGYGLILALAPLRLTDIGATSNHVVLTLLSGAVLAIASTSAAGRLADRYGPGLPALLGLYSSVLAIAVVPFVTSLAWASILTVMYLGPFLALAVVPAARFLTHRTPGRTEVPIIFLFLVAVGGTIGASGGAALTQFGFATPFLVLALLHLVTFVTVPRYIPTESITARPLH